MESLRPLIVVFLVSIIFWGLSSVAKSTYISLNWKANPNAAKYLIEISKDGEFNKILFQAESTESFLKWPLPTPGSYYLRIAIVDIYGQTSEYSKPARLNVALKTPKTLSPPPQQTVFNDTPPELDLRWKPVPGALNYEVEIIKDKESFLKHTLSETQFKTPPLKSGVYTFRIRSLSTNNQASDWSELSGIKITKKLEKPEVQAITSLKIDKSQLEPFLFQWQPIRGATEYELQIAKDRQFEAIYKKEKTSQTEIKLPLTEAQTYFWRVKALDEDNTPEATSAIQSFKLDFLPERQEIKTLFPDEGQTLYTFFPTTPLPFEWTQLPVETGYVFETSKSSDFKESLRWENQNPIFETPGEYFWRVRTDKMVTNAPEIPPQIIVSNASRFNLQVRPKSYLSLGMGAGSAKHNQAASINLNELPNSASSGKLSASRFEIHYTHSSGWILELQHNTYQSQLTLKPDEELYEFPAFVDQTFSIVAIKKAFSLKEGNFEIELAGNVGFYKDFYITLVDDVALSKTSSQTLMGASSTLNWHPNFKPYDIKLNYSYLFKEKYSLQAQKTDISANYNFKNYWLGLQRSLMQTKTGRKAKDSLSETEIAFNAQLNLIQNQIILGYRW